MIAHASGSEIIQAFRNNEGFTDKDSLRPAGRLSNSFILDYHMDDNILNSSRAQDQMAMVRLALLPLASMYHLGLRANRSRARSAHIA